jgi:transcriptional regulator with XRE-family HTH domain
MDQNMTPNIEDTATNAVPKKSLAASASSGQNTPTQQDVNRETRHARKRTRQGATPAPARPHQLFAEKLGAAMKRKGLSPSQLAGLVWGTTKDARGYTVSKGRDRFGHYLNGTSYPNPDNLRRIAEALDTTVEELAVDQPPRAAPVGRNPRPRTTGRLSIIAAPDRAGWDDLEVSRRVPSDIAMQIWQLLKDVERNGDYDNGEQDEPPLGSVISNN